VVPIGDQNASLAYSPFLADEPLREVTVIDPEVGLLPQSSLVWKCPPEADWSFVHAAPEAFGLRKESAPAQHE
jgi:hypothetical protein